MADQLKIGQDGDWVFIRYGDLVQAPVIATYPVIIVSEDHALLDGRIISKSSKCVLATITFLPFRRRGRLLTGCPLVIVTAVVLSRKSQPITSSSNSAKNNSQGELSLKRDVYDLRPVSANWRAIRCEIVGPKLTGLIPGCAGIRSCPYTELLTLLLVLLCYNCCCGFLTCFCNFFSISMIFRRCLSM